MSRRARGNGNGSNGLIEKLKNAPEWAKNAVAIGAVVLSILGVRLDVSNLRTEQDRLDARQNTLGEKAEINQDRIDLLEDDIAKTDRKANRAAQFVRDIQKDLDRILEAIRSDDDSP